MLEIKQLAKLVMDNLENYTEEVAEMVRDETDKIANKGVEELKVVNEPPATELGTANQYPRKSWSKYSSSWSIKDTSQGSKTSRTIYNKKYYRLTHLLEYGHATANGGRTRAFAHIKPIAEEIEKEYENNIEKRLKGGK